MVIRIDRLKSSAEMLLNISRMTILCIILFIQGQHLCSIDICLTWKVTLNSLTLICRMNTLKHRVYIANQQNVTVADCFPSPYQPCESFYPNGSIHLKKEKKLTIYTVKGHINEHVNGNWTCRHGRNKDIAIVDVTVLSIKDTDESMKNCKSTVNHKDARLPDSGNKTPHGIGTNYTKKVNQSTSNDDNCIATLLSWFMGCFIIFMILGRLLSSILVKWCESTIDVRIDKCTSRLFKFKCQFEKKTVSVLKNICLIAILILCMGIVSFIGYWETVPCSHLVILVFAVVGCILGMSSSILIISTEEKNSDIESGRKNINTTNSATGHTSNLVNDSHIEDHGQQDRFIEDRSQQDGHIEDRGEHDSHIEDRSQQDSHIEDRSQRSIIKVQLESLPFLENKNEIEFGPNNGNSTNSSNKNHFNLENNSHIEDRSQQDSHIEDSSQQDSHIEDLSQQSVNKMSLEVLNTQRPRAELDIHPKQPQHVTHEITGTETNEATDPKETKNSKPKRHSCENKRQTTKDESKKENKDLTEPFVVKKLV